MRSILKELNVCTWLKLVKITQLLTSKSEKLQIKTKYMTLFFSIFGKNKRTSAYGKILLTTQNTYTQIFVTVKATFTTRNYPEWVEGWLTISFISKMHIAFILNRIKGMRKNFRLSMSSVSHNVMFLTLKLLFTQIRKTFNFHDRNSTRPNTFYLRNLGRSHNEHVVILS